MTDTLDHAALLALSKELKRPLYTLEVLGNDPFSAGRASRKAGAEWFARLWKKRVSLGVQPGQKPHLHGFHYILVSQRAPVKLPDGKASYENTQECEAVLLRCALDARYLELVPADAFSDRRSVEPTINDTAEAEDATIDITGGEIKYEPLVFATPKLEVYPPKLPPHDHLEIWIEKSTQNGMLGPLCEKQGINFQPGEGEFSHTRCLQLVRRAEANYPRPTRVGTVTDFDPAGQSIPVAISRKVQHLLHIMGLDLDIRVEPIALTHDQCVELRLPRTPLKKDEKRGPAFEERFGEGATELDALEALHPGKLEELVEEWVDSYRESDLQDRIDEAESEAESEVYSINDEVHEAHAADIAVMVAAKEACNAAILAEIEKFKEIAEPIAQKIEDDLRDIAPEPDKFDWPEPDETLGDDDPLFDSTRDYVEQTDRFKEHQGKPTEASIRKPYASSPATCTVCGKAFQAILRNRSMTCSKACGMALIRQKMAAPPIPCSICGEPFRAIRGTTVCPKNDCRNAARRRKRGSEADRDRRGRS